MDQQVREEILIKLATIRELTREVRTMAGMPSLESSLRFCELYCGWAQFLLGESDRFEAEVDTLMFNNESENLLTA